MKPPAPCVAVIITAKDAAATAAKAVVSALRQSAAAEVVFVDDGSRDETAEVARACDDGTGRLKVIRFDENHGPSFGRNVAIASSTAPYFCILDADDFLGEERLARMLAAGGEGWDLLADDIQFCSAPDEATEFDRLLPVDAALPFDLDLERFADANIPRPSRPRRELGFLKPIVRRAFVEQHAIRYDERLRLAEDMIYYARCLMAGGVFRVVGACGYYAVQYAGSLSARHRTADIAALYEAMQETAAAAAGAGQPTHALNACLRYTRDNLALREALDRKRDQGWTGFLQAVGRRPASLPHIIGVVARDKIGLALGRAAR